MGHAFKSVLASQIEDALKLFRWMTQFSGVQAHSGNALFKRQGRLEGFHAEHRLWKEPDRAGVQISADGAHLSYVAAVDARTPVVTRLMGNVPNPFNPVTTIEYSLPRAGAVTVKIYNVRGELVKTLIDAPVRSGAGEVSWDGTDRHGARVAAGVYFYQARALGETTVGKVALVK